MNYNVLDFCEIIEDDDRINFLRVESADGYSARIYESDYGTKVVIDTTEPNPTDSTLKGWLFELGLEDMIPSLFPPSKVEEVQKN